MTYQSLYLLVALVYLISLILFILKKTQLSTRIFFLALFLHLAFLIHRAFIFDFFHPGAALEEPGFLPLCLGGIVLWFRASSKDKEAKTLMPIAILFALIYVVFPKGVVPPSAKGLTIFTPLFFFFEVAAHALFIAGAVMAWRHLGRPQSPESFHQLAVWGFVAYSIAQVTGAIWCYLGWSVPFQWGFRHLHSAVVWCLYANYLHLRFIPWWSNRKKARYLIIAALIMLSYLVVLQLSESASLRLGG